MKHVIGKHKEDQTWLRMVTETKTKWVTNLFEATKFEQNDAVRVAEQLKAAGTKVYTEMITTALSRTWKGHVVT
jgi:hypothetical protein